MKNSFSWDSYFNKVAAQSNVQNKTTKPVDPYINPYKKFFNAWIPEWLLRRSNKEVSNGAKLLYGKLCQHAGKNADCFPKQKTLARELGMSGRSISRHLKELKDLGLIKPVRYGKKRANRYKFLPHEWMEFRDDVHRTKSTNSGILDGIGNDESTN